MDTDTASLLYRHALTGVLVSLAASSGLALICDGQIPLGALCAWWCCMTAVLLLRCADIRCRALRQNRHLTGIQEIRRFGVGVVATAILWTAFPVAFLSQLNQTGRACTIIVLWGMVGGGATGLWPSKLVSLLFTGILVIPISMLLMLTPGTENKFLGILGFVFFAVITKSFGIVHSATMTAVRLSRSNEALVAEMEKERQRTETANVELKAAQSALYESNHLLEFRIQARTADLQKEMKAKEKYARELAHLASTDSLTSLHNRDTLAKRLDQSIERVRTSGQMLAVLFLDLDKFKEVNDLMGHTAGDRILKGLADRLRERLPSSVDLARWGGDEFVVVVPGISSVDNAIDLAILLSACLADPLEAEGLAVKIPATIGISVFPEHGQTAEELILAADIAMYASKEERRPKIRVFDPSLSRRLRERSRLERNLRTAIETDALSIVFQPIITARSGVCESLEVLVRWTDPERGPVPPAQFIPAAERTGEITAIGRWVLNQACREAASWIGSTPPSISVNISVVQIESGTLYDDVFESLQASGLPPSRLHLELTESVFAGDRRNVIPVLQRFREEGIKIWLDDFGTGFSCLADLQRLPIDRIKIDKTFVDSLEKDSAPIVKVILTTAHTFGLEVVAEGVETKAQADYLASMGAHYLQGYLFSRALSPDAAREWLLTHYPAPLIEMRPSSYLN